MAQWRDIVGPVPDVISLNYAESTIGPAGIAIDMLLKGDDLAQLKMASLELQDWIWQYQGVTSVPGHLSDHHNHGCWPVADFYRNQPAGPDPDAACHQPGVWSACGQSDCVVFTSGNLCDP
jgi:hypothetical protein